MTSDQELSSPLIIFLQRKMEAEGNAALESFWQEVNQRGTPLVEEIPGDGAFVLVTFLWRGRETTTNVVVLNDDFRWTNLGGSPGVQTNAMKQLPGTDVWYKSYRIRADFCIDYLLSPNDPQLLGAETDPWAEQWPHLTATWQLDPLNPRQIRIAYDEEDHPEREEYLAGSTWMKPRNSYIELTGFNPQPWFKEQEHVPKGQVEKHHFSSVIMNNTRAVFTYTAPGYSTGDEPYTLLLLFDAWIYHRVIPTPTILDNLLAAKRIPPVCAILIDQPDLRDRREMIRKPFLGFLTEELLPWVRENYHVTTNPAKCIVGGSSLGGLAAGMAGLQHAGIFGKVLMQSGAFTYNPEEGKYIPEGEGQEWLVNKYACSSKLPLEFYLDVGQFEDLLTSSRNMRDNLLAKGNVVHYQEFYGGHNILCWRNTIADGLLALIGA